MADNIFTDEQLYLMRNLIADICYRHIENELVDFAEEELGIINAIQRHFDDPEYVNTEHFSQDGGGSWSEIPDYEPQNNN